MEPMEKGKVSDGIWGKKNETVGLNVDRHLSQTGHSNLK